MTRHRERKSKHPVAKFKLCARIPRFRFDSLGMTKLKKKFKVLVLFDGTSPTTVDQDFSDELKTKNGRPRRM